MKLEFRVAVLMLLATTAICVVIPTWYCYSEVAVKEETDLVQIARGSLGPRLYYITYSPAILRIGSNTTISFKFNVETEIFVKYIYIYIWGSAFPHDFSIYKSVGSNESLDKGEVINYSTLVKPLVEGFVAVRVGAEYNFKNGYSWDYDEVIIEAKSMTYDELHQEYLLFRALTCCFGMLMVILPIAVYVYNRKRNKRNNV